MKPFRKRIATDEQKKKGKKVKTETGSNAVNAPTKCKSIEISHTTDQEKSCAAEEIRRVFKTSEAQSKAIVDLGQRTATG